MSGSGGGGYVPPQKIKFDCDTGAIITIVSSINISILEKHKIGNILDVVIGDKGALLLEDGDGEIIGAILHSNTTDIIDCIKEGANYKAEILSINFPSCKVKIQRG
ncbi:hypothetical protein [Tenacibaculum discolor]|nr:hypothetical protein [Tenacibaculum discolor]MDP2540053.1 hypothetical protein [Tenacibaculum discolor]PHO01979.1 hypothetical protein CSC82_20775 [Rhodobacteraceae bacterium 4F10]